MTRQDFLLEIGSEEIPARFVSSGIKQLTTKLEQLLKDERITYQQVESFATPRRLAVRIGDVSEKQEDTEEEVRGPAVRIAKTEDGQWSKAAIGFARKNGVSLDDLEVREHKGEEYIFALRKEKGRPTLELLSEKLPALISSLSFPVTMRWGARKERFIRPVRWILALLGEEVIPFAWAGVKADRVTYGHRFLGEKVSLSSPAEYVERLRAQSVIVDPEERKAQILSQIKELENENGWRVPIDPDLLEEVTHLVEVPTVLFGTYEEKFLQIPKKVLITTMREHQRYFPVENQSGELLPYFLTVRNGDKHCLDIVTKGNEKVLSARLADAEFFYQEDQKQPIASYLEQLDKIVYHDKLGTIGDRVQRITLLAEKIGKDMNLPAEEMEDLLRAAKISKFDLATQMVDEFPELQGYMGRIYAQLAGENERVAEVIEDHYRPHHGGDKLPAMQISTILSIADKIDQIAASFGIGIQPTGSQDPYGLRRLATGVTQIYLHQESLPPLDRVISYVIDILEKDQLLLCTKEELRTELRKFLSLRIRSTLQEEIRYDVLDAVLKSGIEQPRETEKKARVLMEQLSRAGFKEEVEGFTRVANLAKKAAGKRVETELLQEEEEKKLFAVYEEALEKYHQASKKKDFVQMYQTLAEMAPEIHQFFDHILVMVEDEKIRENRLALLASISELTARFAHFNFIVFPSE